MKNIVLKEKLLLTFFKLQLNYDDVNEKNTTENTNCGFHFLPDNNDRRHVGSTLKLLNINAAAKHLLDNYSGPSLTISSGDSLIRDVKVSPGLAKVQFNQSVLEAFSTLCPPPRLSSININTMLGFTLEAECVLDSSGRPLPVTDFSNNFSDITGSGSKALASGSRRVAVLTASFQDCLLGGEVSGVTSLNMRLLEALGYKVILVKFSDWPSTEKLVVRVKYLDEEMKKVSG